VLDNYPVPRFKLLIEYAGTRYSGWQIQTNARTVQGEIDRAVRRVTARREFELCGSGRTDAGVHVLGQVATLDLQTTLSPEELTAALNDGLPADINVLATTRVPHRFHARHDAVARSYLYLIALRRTAFAKPYVWWVKEVCSSSVSCTPATGAITRWRHRCLRSRDRASTADSRFGWPHPSGAQQTARAATLPSRPRPGIFP